MDTIRGKHFFVMYRVKTISKKSKHIFNNLSIILIIMMLPYYMNTIWKIVKFEFY